MFSTISSPRSAGFSYQASKMVLLPWKARFVSRWWSCVVFEGFEASKLHYNVQICIVFATYKKLAQLESFEPSDL
jgi:hypothetical protein